MADPTSKRPVDSSVAPTRTSSPASPAAAEDTDLSPVEEDGAVSEPDETAGGQVVRGPPPGPKKRPQKTFNLKNPFIRVNYPSKGPKAGVPL